MTEKKNQHFVPRLYLRQFSINNENNKIGLFYLDKHLYKHAVPLKSQGKEDYFYGKDGVLEENLSKLESMAAPCLQSIITTNELPLKSSESYYKILIFSVLMANRTKDSAAQVKELSDKLAKEILSYGEENTEITGKYQIHPKNAAAMALEATFSKLPIAYDLKMKLIINNSNLKFLTSDHPVIKYNQFLNCRKHPGGNVGLAMKGLELFFPISPVHLLCIYDEWAYKVGDKCRDVIEIKSPLDIEKLNYLQFLNCYDHIYFSHEFSEYEIRKIYEKAKTKRLDEYSSLQKVHEYTDDKGLEHAQYHSYGHNLNINLQLSFITQTKRAKKHVLSDYFIQLRDENLRNNFR